MMTNDGGPAFPVPMIPVDRDGGHTEVRYQGISVRDYFAAAAMQIFERVTPFDAEKEHGHYLTQMKLLAADLYALADAMLAARGEVKDD
jgi:hypothetical protein